VSKRTRGKWRIIDVPMDMGHVARAGHAPDVAVVHATLGVTG
jgi:hypothetical protein